MKSYKSLILLSAALCLAACTAEEKIGIGDKPGDAGSEEVVNEGVYFATLTPEQKTVILDPADETVLEFTAYRTAEEKAIDVPVEVKLTADGTEIENTIFEVAKPHFDEGQTETTFKVSFPNSEIGVTYACSIECSDPAFVGTYGDRPTGLSFTVSRVKWELVKGPNGEEYGSWKDDIISSMFGLPNLYAVNDKIQIYERSDKKGYYRIPDVYNAYMIDKLTGWGEADCEENCTPGTYAYVDATKPDKVFLEYCTTGVTLGDDGEIEYCSYVEPYFKGGDAFGTLENGVIRFPVKGILINFTVSGGWYYGNQSGLTTIVLPGYKDNDYSLSIEATELSYQGKLPVDFTLGADIATCKYAAYEGVEKDLPGKASEIFKDTNAQSVTESGTVEFSFDKTGKYTIIAIGLDKDGALQSDPVSIVVNYVAADDSVPVVLTCGIGSAEKYAPKGISTDNSVEFFLYGSELVDVKVIACSKADIASNQQGCIQKLLKSKSLSAEQIAEVNGDGLVSVISKLLPGTEYYILAYGSNGFEEDVFLSSSSQFTTGDPLPVYQNYTSNDADYSFEIANEQVLYDTKWNLYATDLFGKLGMREYIGNAVFTDSDTPDEDLADATQTPVYNYKDEYVYVSGFAGPYAKKGGFDDRIEAVLEDGLLVVSTQKNTVADADMLVHSLTAEGKAYSVAFGLFGIPVADGYYAFVSNPGYTNQGVEMAGLGYYKGGFYAGYIDYLLVDASKDDNGLAPKASAKIAAVNDALKIASANWLQTPKQRIKYALSQAEKQPKSYDSIAPIRGTRSCEKASFKSNAVKGNASKAIAPMSLKAKGEKLAK